MAGEELFTMDPIAALSTALGISRQLALIILLVIGVWSLIWKGFALWKAAKKDHNIAFIIILIANTIGIIEILYIYLFSEMKFFNKKSNTNKKSKKK